MSNPSLEDADALAARALEALAGRDCSVCGKAIRPGTRVCCGVAVCPWCRRPYFERCPHLVGLSRRYPGLEYMVVDPGPPPDIASLGTGSLGWSESEMREALGGAYGIATHLHGIGLEQAADPSRVWSALCAEVTDTQSSNLHHYDTSSGAWRYGEAWFHADPGAFAKQARQIMDDWHRGIERLARSRPAAASMMRFWYDVPAPCTQITFSPDAELLLVLIRSCANLIDTGTGKVCQQIELGAAADAAIFDNDGASILFFIPGAGGSSRVVRWERATGAMRTVREDLTARRTALDASAAGFLHAGAVLAFASTHDVVLVRADTEVSEHIRHRQPLARLVLAPQGGAFVTETRRHIILWKAPMPGESPDA